MPSPDRLSASGAGDPNPFLGRLFVERTSPSELLQQLVAALKATPELDEELCCTIGCGNLEALLREHERELWPAVEKLARSDLRFRVALEDVAAYDSPMFNQRRALLDELENPDVP